MQLCYTSIIIEKEKKICSSLFLGANYFIINFLHSSGYRQPTHADSKIFIIVDIVPKRQQWNKLQFDLKKYPIQFQLIDKKINHCVYYNNNRKYGKTVFNNSILSYMELKWYFCDEFIRVYYSWIILELHKLISFVILYFCRHLCFFSYAPNPHNCKGIFLKRLKVYNNTLVRNFSLIC